MTQTLRQFPAHARARCVPQLQDHSPVDGSIRREIETMRASLQDALDRCDRLLAVSPGAVAPTGARSSQDAVVAVVNAIYPAGKPLGMRKGKWIQQIIDECKAADIIAGERTVRRALGGK